MGGHLLKMVTPALGQILGRPRAGPGDWNKVGIATNLREAWQGRFRLSRLEHPVNKFGLQARELGSKRTNELIGGLSVVRSIEHPNPVAGWHNLESPRLIRHAECSLQDHLRLVALGKVRVGDKAGDDRRSRIMNLDRPFKPSRSRQVPGLTLQFQHKPRAARIGMDYPFVAVSKKRSTDFPCPRFNRRPRLVGHFADKGGDSGLDDPGFLCSNFRQSWPQKFGVIKPDRDDGCGVRTDDIGDIEPTPDPDFHHCGIAPNLLPVPKRHCGFELERAGRRQSFVLKLLIGCLNRLFGSFKILSRDELAIDLDSFADIKDVGGVRRSGFDSARGEDGLDDSARASLTIGSGDMVEGTVSAIRNVEASAEFGESRE